MKRARYDPLESPEKDLDFSVSIMSSDSVSSPELDQRNMDGDSPKAVDWKRILKKSDGFEQKHTYINDSVHGHIKIPEICRAIIDTPQFDRLRGIRQLGVAHYVYPCAKHTRWEHSVGVMHLAGEFVNHLRHPDKYPGCCDEKDQLCVMIAGLCHDLGHGPLSHLWESFVDQARPNCKWSHEKSSIEMFQHLIEENNLMAVFEKHGFSEQDLLFIKELIYGPLGEQGEYIGRPAEKHFLYEIVANKISSIDVDKWDYFLRDNQAMKIGLTFDYKRFILMSHLHEIEGKLRLAIEEKEATNIKKMFEDRARLHQQGYQHRVIKIIDRMMIDILLEADQHIKICTDREGNYVRLSEACEDMYAYSQLTDEYVLQTIQHSRQHDLQEARNLLKRLVTRRLYKIVVSIRCKGLNLSPMKDTLQKSLSIKIKEEANLLNTKDLVFSLKKVSTGMGKSNPVEQVLFVDTRGRCTRYSSKHLKEFMNFEEETLYVILRREGAELQTEAANIVKSWCEEEFNKTRLDISFNGKD